MRTYLCIRWVSCSPIWQSLCLSDVQAIPYIPWLPLPASLSCRAPTERRILDFEQNPSSKRDEAFGEKLFARSSSKDFNLRTGRRLLECYGAVATHMDVSPLRRAEGAAGLRNLSAAHSTFPRGNLNVRF